LGKDFCGRKREEFSHEGTKGRRYTKGAATIFKDFQIKGNVVRGDMNHGFKIKFVDGGNL
jgi:hypothetical protein